MSRRRLPRLMLRSGCLLAAVLALWPALPWEESPRIVVAASPLVAVSAGVATRDLGLATGLGMFFTLICCLRRRWFCRYVCPTGLLLDAVANAGPGWTRAWSAWPDLGRIAALLTLAGACVGYPLFLWLDPLALLAGTFAAPGSTVFFSGLLAGLLFGILILLTFLLGTVWCTRICPLGGFQDLIGGIVQNIPTPARSHTRRRFLTTLTTVAGGVAVAIWGRLAGAARAEAAPLRPPGAITEDRFTGVCIRCGNCASACPPRIIHPDRGVAGIPGLLAPSLRFSEGNYCRPDCTLCTQVCPSGALQALALPDKTRYIIGEALVDTNYCLTTLGIKDCNACVVSCPFEAVQLHWDEEMYVSYPVVEVMRCNGCGACEAACPTLEVKAVSIWPLLLTTGANDGLIPADRFLPVK
jgi:ferredoxin